MKHFYGEPFSCWNQSKINYSLNRKLKVKLQYGAMVQNSSLGIFPPPIDTKINTYFHVSKEVWSSLKAKLKLNCLLTHNLLATFFYTLRTPGARGPQKKSYNQIWVFPNLRWEASLCLIPRLRFGKTQNQKSCIQRLYDNSGSLTICKLPLFSVITIFFWDFPCHNLKPIIYKS